MILQRCLTSEGADCCLLFLGVSSVVSPRGIAASPGDKNSKVKCARGKKSIFEAYLSREEVSEGLKRGTLIQVLGTSREGCSWRGGVHRDP